VILFKNDKEKIFQKFANDVISKVEIITLPKEAYKDLADIRNNLGLDFDDAYQFKIAKEYDLKIVTMDKDFEKAKDRIDVIFL
jgi:predicted nucleic acid-binding protein